MVTPQMMMSMRSMKAILTCACAVLAVSCAENNEIAKPAPETRTITLNATSETIASQDKTRTALDQDGLSVVWKKGDLLQLWYLKSDGSYAKAGELTALSKGNTTTFTGECTFTDEAETPDYLAVSCYCADGPEVLNTVKYENGKFVFSNPGEASAVFKPWFNYPSNNSYEFAVRNPAVAHGADLNAMTFKNIFGVMKLTIQTRPNAQYRITFQASGMSQRQDFTGEYHYDPATGTGELTRDYITSPITIAPQGQNLGEEYVHYIPVAPGDYNNFTMQVSDSGETYYEQKATKSLEIKAGVITNLGRFADNLQ